MKKAILILILMLGTFYQTFAQQKSKTKHMTIAFSGLGFGPAKNTVTITRDDTAQIKKEMDLNPHVKRKDFNTAYETLLMEVLEPYYNDGWKLVTIFDDKPMNNTVRYYFTKDN